MRALLVAALAASLMVAGCFKVDEPPCAYSCGPNGECPDDYQCGADNFCHLHGTGVCFYPDAAMTADMSFESTADLPFEIETDFSVPPDLTAADL